MSQMRSPRVGDSLERTRYFPRQVITPPDLADDRDHVLQKIRRHNRLLHDPGIYVGLTVKKVPVRGAAGSRDREIFEAFLREVYHLPAGQGTPPPPDVILGEGEWLAVLPGYALTPLGDEIYLSQPVFLNTSEELYDALVIYPTLCSSQANPRSAPRDDGPLNLIVEAFESETRPVRAASSRCGDHPDQFEFSRIKDTLRFRLVKDPPEESDFLTHLNGPEGDDAALLLAEVEFLNEKITSVTMHPPIQESGQAGPIAGSTVPPSTPCVQTTTPISTVQTSAAPPCATTTTVKIKVQHRSSGWFGDLLQGIYDAPCRFWKWLT